MPEWMPLPRSQWDELRIPVPGFKPKPAGAHYSISLAGRVRRNDGLIWLPRPHIALTSGLPTSLIVRLGGGQTGKSLAKLMHTAFAKSRDLPDQHPNKPGEIVMWRPWLQYAAEIDPVTGERNCCIDNIVIAPHYQIVSFTRGCTHNPPETQRFDAIGRDVPISREFLENAGYKFSRETRYAQLDDATGSHRIDKVHIAC